jgi:hypothetical protein
MIKDYAYGHIFFAQRLIKRCPQLQNGQFPPNVEDCADNDRDKEKIRNEKHKIEVDLVAEYGRPRVAQCTANFLGNDEL